MATDLPFRRRFAFKALTAASAIALLVSGCAMPVAGPNGLYAQPIGNAPVTANPTPYSAALVCLGEYARARGLRAPRIAVGRISDYTGKEESDGSGRKLTQGASLMAISALAKAGAPLVERYDTSVSELELKYANNKLITDDPNNNPNAPTDYRKIMSGQVPGSDFYLVGGITELNFNIRSSGLNADGGTVNTTGVKASLGATTYVMNVGLDMRLVNTRTLEVVDVISYQKQIVGREISAGVFDIFHGVAVDVDAGNAGLEPLQLGVRALIERGVLEMMANIYGAPGPQVCLNPADDVLADNTAGVTGGYTPAYNNLASNNAHSRENPYRWDSRRDPDVAADQRGRY
ncbi:MAG TPA: holdfast anchoring protein HfaB [Caulobacteraceae bacterium]|nr:holdfast anchoring protein HfaB [Caulobacteraceae bacterium]